ncbi:MAG: 3-phosphoshikimate 1-carboxyvinyltransferase [Candidatus Puniceispirillaceae bacterium]
MSLSLISQKTKSLSGTFDVPGDKSISHRSMILGSIAIGQTKVSGLLEGDDVLATKQAMIDCGADITKQGDDYIINGVGMGGLTNPEQPLDLGNAGTGVRLLMGLIAGQSMTATFVGDASLSKRPMRRITDPLEEMGAQVTCAEGGRLPVTITGLAMPLPISYSPKVASAQIKSAILLAGLQARGETTVIEPHISRDHTEAMLRHFGVTVTQEIDEEGRHHVTMTGGTDLIAKDILVPRDPSSAAFVIVAALLTKDSDVFLPAIGMNPQRTGLITTLQEMGGDITLSNQRLEGGEEVADIRVRSSELHGIDVPPARAASMIDEYPILSVAASMAKGTTMMSGVAELRVKETDRIAVMAKGLATCGVQVEEGDDYMAVTGGTMPPAGGAVINSQHDHRIGMSFLVLGMISEQPITVDDVETINTSFPGFADKMNAIGAQISPIS